MTPIQTVGSIRKSKKRSALSALTVAASMTVAACFPGLARAGRHIEIQSVAAGSVGMTHAGRDTTLTVSNGAIINYSQFNIPAGSVVTFVEPSAASQVLNRINSVSPSQLNGSLNANGIVYFVNPSGIVFGPHSIVSAPGLYAIAGKFSNSDFANGVSNFTASGAVTNMGQITAGSVVLVGDSVQNSGSVVAGQGMVVMSMGGNTYLGQAGQSIYVQVNTPAPASKSSSAATPPPPVMGAGDMYWNALSSTGSIKANTIALSGGGGAVKVSGSLDASSATAGGGSIQITGKSIAINHASINASGLTGGGTVDIGGGAHGKDANIPDADVTTIDSSSVINAGDGGNVVVWSNLYTGFHGTVLAPAGWVETSSAGVLDVDGSSVQTPGGTWLMDPANVEITAATNLDENESSTSSSPVTFTSTAASSPSDTKISAATINTAINTDNDDVIITTQSSLTDLGTITQDVGANISNTSGGARSLTLEAAGGITLNGTISASGSGNSLNVTMAAEDGTSEIAGTVMLNNSITTNGGTISVNAQTITQGAFTISSAGGMMDFEGGTFSAAASSLLDSAGAKIKIGTADADGTITTTANPITFLNALTLDNNLTVDAGATGTIKFMSTVDALTAGGQSLTTKSDVSTSFNGAVGSNFPLSSLKSGGSTAAGNGTTTLGAATVNTTGAGGQTFTNAVVLTSNNTLTTTTAGGIDFTSTIDGGFELTLSSVGAAEIDGNVGATTPLVSIDITASGGATTLGGNVTTDGSGQDYTTAVTLTSGSGSSQTFTDTGGSTVAFGSTVAGTNANLILDGGGGNDLENTVSVLSLQAMTRVVIFNNVTTTGGGQTYANVTLNTGATPALADSSDGDITFGGTLDGAATLAVDSNGGIFFDGQVGHTTPVTSITTQGYPNGAGGTTTFNISTSPSVVTTGAQVYGNSVALAADATFQSGGNILFNSTVDGAHNLTTETDDSATFAGAVGSHTALTSLTTEGVTTVGSGATTVSGASVNTGSGGVTIDNPLTLTAATTSFSTVSGGAVLFSTVTGTTTDLIVAGAGGNTFDNTATVEALTGQTATTLDNNVTTTKGQTYAALTLADGSPQTLMDNIDIKFVGAIGGSTTALTVNSPLVELSGKFANTIVLTAGGSNATVDVHNGGSIDQGVSLLPVSGGVLNVDPGTYAESVAIASTLTLNNTNVGGVAPVNANSWSVTAPITINGEFGATTANGFTFAQPVTLGGAVGLSGSGTASFASTINGGFGLSISTAGPATFSGVVSASFVQVSNGTDINTSNITTTGTQNYTGAVTLSSATTLTSTGNNAITFGSSINGGFGLTIATTGLTSFGGGVSAAFVQLSGPADVNASYLTTVGTQSYTGAVTLTSATSLTSTGNGAITFDSTVSGPFGLTVTTGGLTKYEGAVNIASLQQNGPADVNTPTITTSGAQDFAGAVTLSDAANFTSTGNAGITFGSTVNGAFGLTTTTGGSTTFDGVVSAAAVQVNGPSVIDTTNITTTGAQDYTGAMTLSDAATFTSTGGSEIAFASTVAGAFGLSTATTGTSVFDGGVSAAFVQVSGPSNINAMFITTNGTQNFTGAVTLLSGTTLTSTGTGTGANITFGSTVNGAFALDLATGGTATFTGAVGGSTPLTSLTSDTGDGVFDSTVAVSGALTTNFTTFNGGVSAASVQVLESSTINAPYITTSGSQTYEEAITLASATTLTSTGNQPIQFLETVDGPFALNVVTGGTTTFSESVGSLAPLASLTVSGLSVFDETVNITGGLTTAATRFSAAVSAGFVNVNGAADLFGSSVTTSGTQEYVGALTIGSGNPTLASTGNQAITFDSTVDGPGGLTVATAAVTTFTGAVGGISPPASLTVTAGPSVFDSSVAVAGALATGNATFDSSVTAGSVSTGAASINGGGVTTTGVQTFTGPVTLGMATTLGMGSAPLTFDSTISGAFPLIIATSGLTTFDGNVGVASLQLNGPADVNAAAITTSGTQNYAGAVALSVAPTFTSTGNGAITFDSTVSGPFALTTATGGLSKFAGAVSVASVQVNGPADINTSTVTTSGGQIYSSAVTLSSASLLSSTGGANVTFSSTVNGAFGLTVATGGTTTFSGVVGGATPPTALTVTEGPSVFDANVTVAGPLATGATQFNGTVAAASLSTGTATIDGGSVVTTGAQAYGGAVTLGGDAVFNSGAGATTFASTLNGPYNLTLIGTGMTSFDGAVSTGSMQVDGPVDINTATVTTGSTQLYENPVLLTSNTTLTSSGGDAITFNSRVDGAFSLTVDTPATTYFGAGVGGGTALASLTVTSGPSIIEAAVTTTGALDTGETTFNGPVSAQSLSTQNATISGGTVTTSQAQTYGGAVSLGAAAVLTSGGNLPITFDSTVTGASALTTDTLGPTAFDGAVNVSSLYVTGPAAIGASITTSGTQIYNGAVSITGAATLTSTGTGPATIGSSPTSGAITFASSVSGGSLTVASDVNIFFRSAVGTLTSLTTQGHSTPSAGMVSIEGASVNTTGLQDYKNAVATGTTTFNSNGNPVTFGSTLDGNANVTIAAGTTTFVGAVGGVTPLANLTVTGPSVFESSVNVTSELSTDATTFAGNVAAEVVIVNGNADINTPSVTTSGNLIFNEPVVLTSDTTLTGGSVVLKDSVSDNSGPFSLAIQSTGATVLGGNISGLASVSITAGSDTADAPNADIIVGGNIGVLGNISFNAAGGANLIQFVPASGTSTTISAGGNVTFNRTSALNNDQYATIVSFAGPGGQEPTELSSLTISGANVSFDEGEKLTALGNITISAPGGTAALGDLSAQGAIDVTGSTIDILERPPASGLLTNISDGTDFVGNSIAFNFGSINAIEPAGQNDLTPRFAAPSVTSISSSLTTAHYTVLGYLSQPALSDTNLFYGVTGFNSNGPFVIDLQAEGNSIVDPAGAIAGAVPREIPQPQEDTATSPFQLKRLEDLGIVATSPTFEQLISYLQGTTVYNDLPEGESMGSVTANRLYSKAVSDVLANYDDVFVAPVLGPDGKPVLDSQGLPEKQYLQRHIRGVFIAARRSFIATEGAGKFTPLAFRDFILNTPGEQEAAADLQKLARLFGSVQELGLNSEEYAKSRDYILGGVVPPGMSPAQFYQTIMGQ